MHPSPFPAAGATVTQLVRGPAGDIECLLASPRRPSADAGCALICHPHPLMGGAMSNKVVYTLAAAALDCGLETVRFNFRGVGASAGVHDHGNGETADTEFLAGWLREKLPGHRLVLAGFSFGAHVSLRAAAQVRPDMQISIAPPLSGKYAASGRPARPQAPWLVVHGRDDEVVSYDETVAALSVYEPPPELVALDGVGHFFHGRLTELRGIVRDFIGRHG
ncbi:MAG TPA: alpha/beta fold hydrolase [Nevskiaceae bacterium]|nr:alpha/beta fold hydrolase [Nevskiaceae bacterium]